MRAHSGTGWCFDEFLRAHVDLIDRAHLIGLRIDVKDRESADLAASRDRSLANASLHFRVIDLAPAR